MNTEKAMRLGQTVFELMVLTARYEGKYGRGKPKHDSPEAAWVLAAQLLYKQIEIAKQLDPIAIANGAPRILGQQAPFDSYMSTPLVHSLLGNVGNLLIYCAQVEAKPATDPSTNTARTLIGNTQYIISRLIDPEAVRVAEKGTISASGSS